ncbi:prolyl oligopeptidase family serine peptidase [Kribbella sandramycini]|uniref:Cephalosporin-C deacetylase n=1 Tax=Kribbella sandramycini TaxID=60450 RepID=A0A7Y4NYL1_9ACTN|nr:acetylxylan esterase [Kribbella sandramycini]MBB6568146.1 cephalosporin-C deacetylase [Kribbella sandramycini]NOL39260.1 prolyl oligopeptidase family serine peptidase [Kribbella sandramycini]
MRDLVNTTVDVTRPADFDDFWAAGLAACPPLDPVLTEMPTLSTERVRVYDVSYVSYGGLRVSAWYAVPRSDGPYPGLITIPGYISEPTIPKEWAELGYAALAVAPRGKLRSNAVFDPGYPGLLTHNIVDHHTYGYRGFYLDVVRAVDVLLGRPEADSDRIGLAGSSQGGGLGISTAALRPEVIKAVACGAPYLCGIMTAPTLTRSYPYEEINEYLRLHPRDVDRVRETVAYYDGLNFAPAVQAPTMIYLGLEDDVCPPETGFALHRALPGEKTLHTYPNCAHHAGLPGVLRVVEEFLADHLKPGS